MSKSETHRHINHAIQTLGNLVESDTDVTLVDLNLIENLNTNQSLNYIRLEQNLVALEESAKDLKQMDKEIQDFGEVLGSIEKNVTKMEALGKELDMWSKDLENKMNEKGI